MSPIPQREHAPPGGPGLRPRRVTAVLAGGLATAARVSPLLSRRRRCFLWRFLFLGISEVIVTSSVPIGYSHVTVSVPSPSLSHSLSHSHSHFQSAHAFLQPQITTDNSG